MPHDVLRLQHSWALIKGIIVWSLLFKHTNLSCRFLKRSLHFSILILINHIINVLNVDRFRERLSSFFQKLIFHLKYFDVVVGVIKRPLFLALFGIILLNHSPINPD